MRREKKITADPHRTQMTV